MLQETTICGASFHRTWYVRTGGGDKLRPLHGALLPPGLAEGLRGAGRAASGSNRARGYASHHSAP